MTAAPEATAAAGRRCTSARSQSLRRHAVAGLPCQAGRVAELKEQLRADLTTAMKARDELRTATLRMVLTAVTTEEVAGKEARELSDDEVLAVLRREAKKRREAAEAFGAAGRAEQAERERAEGEVLAGYLPAQLDDAELAALVADAIATTGAAGHEGHGPGDGRRQRAGGRPGRRRPGRRGGPPPAGLTPSVPAAGRPPSAATGAGSPPPPSPADRAVGRRAGWRGVLGRRCRRRRARRGRRLRRGAGAT